MSGIDIRLGYTNLQDVLDGKWTAHYESISDILISRFLGVIQLYKHSQGRNIFVIEFDSSWQIINYVHSDTEIRNPNFQSG